MTTYDTIIAGGMVVDGTRAQRLRADVGIKDGQIAKIGRLRASDADEVLDADGMIVAPGHIDLHTHYDAQLFWDPYCTLSGWHGVTSIVIGNCGFGFAPVAPEDRDRAMLTMTRTEAIPFDAMAEGMPWDWVTYPEFLDAVDRTPKAVNMRSFFPLNPALNWVLGYERAKAGEMPTDEEHAQLKALLHEAMDVGAGGWSVQRLRDSNVQRDHDGNPMNTDVMPNETLFQLAEVLAERNQGFIQATFAPDPADETRTEHRRTYERLADISGRPVLFNVITPNAQRPEQHLKQIEWVESCRLRGLPIYGQAVTTDVGLAFTFEEWNLWDDMEAWREATLGTVEERLYKLADPARRPVLRDSESVAVTCPIADIVLLEASSPQYQRYAETRVGDIAADLGVHPVDAMLDIAVADNLAATFYASGSFNNPDHLVDLLNYQWALPGVSDGGAHTRFLTAGRWPTELLINGVRDREIISLEDAHWRMAGLPAQCAGFTDRGTLTPGQAADVIVYDLDSLAIGPSEKVHDMPAGEWRRVQRASGYQYVLVNGEITIQEDKETGTSPGRLLREQ
ncbi:N-acyl-D-amino-acid deacylase family protein [Candidatus Poriferisocius sp.]|uniref:N-acyl-D-amino-acid deacylase family protein n=1 Tax=Candidatus Poriferisocius sp. TaxID=3101276 RepID=UPI003B01C42B